MTLLTHSVSANEAKTYSQNRLKESVSKESNNKPKEPLFELKNNNKEMIPGKIQIFIGPFTKFSNINFNFL